MRQLAELCDAGIYVVGVYLAYVLWLWLKCTGGRLGALVSMLVDAHRHHDVTLMMAWLQVCSTQETYTYGDVAAGLRRQRRAAGTSYTAGQLAVSLNVPFLSCALFCLSFSFLFLALSFFSRTVLAWMPRCSRRAPFQMVAYLHSCNILVA